MKEIGIAAHRLSGNADLVIGDVPRIPKRFDIVFLWEQGYAPTRYIRILEIIPPEECDGMTMFSGHYVGPTDVNLYQEFKMERDLIILK
jgi:hypothetical protein